MLKGVARANKTELGGPKADFGRSVVNQARTKNNMRHNNDLATVKVITTRKVQIRKTLGVPCYLL